MGLFKKSFKAVDSATTTITEGNETKRFQSIKYWLAIAEWINSFVRGSVDFIRNLEPFPKKADYYV